MSDSGFTPEQRAEASDKLGGTLGPGGRFEGSAGKPWMQEKVRPWLDEILARKRSADLSASPICASPDPEDAIFKRNLRRNLQNFFDKDPLMRNRVTLLDVSWDRTPEARGQAADQAMQRLSPPPSPLETSLKNLGFTEIPPFLPSGDPIEDHHMTWQRFHLCVALSDDQHNAIDVIDQSSNTPANDEFYKKAGALGKTGIFLAHEAAHCLGSGEIPADIGGFLLLAKMGNKNIAQEMLDMADWRDYMLATGGALNHDTGTSLRRMSAIIRDDPLFLEKMRGASARDISREMERAVREDKRLRYPGSEPCQRAEKSDATVKMMDDLQDRRYNDILTFAQNITTTRHADLSQNVPEFDPLSAALMLRMSRAVALGAYDGSDNPLCKATEKLWRMQPQAFQAGAAMLKETGIEMTPPANLSMTPPPSPVKLVPQHRLSI